jgi:hypothetical protein
MLLQTNMGCGHVPNTAQIKVGTKAGLKNLKLINKSRLAGSKIIKN